MRGGLGWGKTHRLFHPIGGALRGGGGQTFAKSRAKAGVSAEAIEPGDVARIPELLSKKQLKEHIGDEGELSYTLTAAGKKRLEKAKADLKAL